MSRRASWFSWVISDRCALFHRAALQHLDFFPAKGTRHPQPVRVCRRLLRRRLLAGVSLSCFIAALTIVASLALIVPTAFWVTLRMPRWRGVVEFITLLPFVIPAIVLVFGVIKTYGKPVTVLGIPVLPSLLNSSLSTNIVLVRVYTVLALPYMYRATDNGLRAIDVRTLAEAGQSLGASWFVVITRVIIPTFARLC